MDTVENKNIEDIIIKELFSRLEYKEEEKYWLLTNFNEHISKIYKEIYNKFISKDEISKVIENLKENNIIEIKENKEEKVKFYSLTTKGREYALDNEYITNNEITRYSTDIYYKLLGYFADLGMSLTESKKDIINLNNNVNEIKEVLIPSVKKVKEHETNIKSFYNNIISIMSILIAAFSIIGFNIGGIKFIVENKDLIKPWEYAGSIGVINLGIIVSLYFLFYLLNIIVNPNNEERPKPKKINIFNNKVAIFLLIAFIILVSICFFIA